MSSSLSSVLNNIYGSLARSSVYRVTGANMASSLLSVGQPSATHSMAIVRNTTPVSNTPNLPQAGMTGLVDFMNVFVPNGEQLLRDFRAAIAMGTLAPDAAEIAQIDAAHNSYKQNAFTGARPRNSTTEIDV